MRNLSSKLAVDRSDVIEKGIEIFSVLKVLKKHKQLKGKK